MFYFRETGLNDASEVTSVTEVLSAPHVLEYAYTRSTGPVVGAFIEGLAEGKILGSKADDGHVIVPPLEYDPRNGDTLSDLVEVGTEGVVTTWTWLAEPRPNNPLQKPFAWALIRLDGADTAMLHAVDAGDESAMRTGMRVRARFKAEPKGLVTDLECFEPLA